MKKVSKEKKKGKLNKKDVEDKDPKVETEVYFKMFSSMGGSVLLVPFFGAISLFSYLEVYREK